MMKVILEFELTENVTPEIFARKVAIACARGGALRYGEKVITHTTVYEYDRDEMTDLGFTEISLPYLLVYAK